MGSLEDEVRREIVEEGMRQRAQERYFNVSDHPALSEFRELLRNHKVPPVRFYKNVRSGTSMFGLGFPFTVYSAGPEGWLIQKPDYDGPSDTCFAFTTTGEVYIRAILEKCINPHTFAKVRGISSDDTIAVYGDEDLRFVSLAEARRCTFGDRSSLSELERDYLRPALRQVLEHRVTKGIFILSY
ncbi:hypothetical protein [Schaalia cardiffensis]